MDIGKFEAKLTEFFGSLQIEVKGNDSRKCDDPKPQQKLSCYAFFVALLREILLVLDPKYELWDKIKYVAFLINLVSTKTAFSTVHQIFSQLENEIHTSNLSWKDDHIKDILIKKLVNVNSTNDGDETFGENYENLKDEVEEVKTEIHGCQRSQSNEEALKSLPETSDFGCREEYISLGQEDIDKIELDLDMIKNENSYSDNEDIRDNNELECEVCMKSFTSVDQLEKHKPTHRNGEGDSITSEIKCDVCNKSFATMRHLNDHKRYHQDGPSFCEICQSKFKNMFSLRSHIYVKHRDKYKEMTLKMNFKDVLNKDSNMESDTNAKDSFTCVPCNKSFTQNDDLNQHQRENHSVNSCDSCEESFSSQKHFDHHIHKIETSCKVCNLQFKNKKTLKDHNKIIHPEVFICGICNKEFCSNAKYKLHLKENHHEFYKDIFLKSKTKKRKLNNKNTIGPILENGNETRCAELGCTYDGESPDKLRVHWFQEHFPDKLCTICGFLCTSLEDYNIHRQSHNVDNYEQVIRVRKKKKKEEDTEKLHCKLCNCLYIGEKALERHMHYAHSDKKKDKIPCHICGKQYSSEGSLYIHKMEAHGNQVFQCDLCDYSSNSKYNFNVHRKRHFLKAVECPECGTATKDLRQHLRMSCKKNLVKGVFSCNECDKSFFKKGTLERHMESEHPEEKKYSCEYCDYKAYRNSNIRNHMRKVHKKEISKKTRCKFCNKLIENLEQHMKIIHAQQVFKEEERNLERLEVQLM